MPQFATTQYTATSTPQSVDPNGGYNTKRVMLMASATGAYVGNNSKVTTGTGAAIPTTHYLSIETQNPRDVFVVGANTVYVVLELERGSNA